MISVHVQSRLPELGHYQCAQSIDDGCAPAIPTVCPGLRDGREVIVRERQFPIASISKQQQPHNEGASILVGVPAGQEDVLHLLPMLGRVGRQGNEGKLDTGADRAGHARERDDRSPE